MRILLVGPIPPPVGGMATVVKNLFDAYSTQAEVRILNNAKTTAVDRPLLAGIVSQLQLLGRLTRELLVWRPDAVHIHTCSFFTFWRNCIDVLLARLLGRRVFLHIHGGRFHEFLAGLSPRGQYFARLALKACHRVIVLGDNWQELLAPWLPADRSSVVPNGVPLPEQGEQRDFAALAIICLANYEHLKGQEDLIRAVDALNDARVRVNFYGGETEPGEKERLATLVDELGLGQQVVLHASVSGEAKDTAMREANCFCLPSYAEGLPMSMLEAMAERMPVVVTDVGSIPDVVSSGENALVYKPGDLAALIEHLRTLQGNPDNARRLGDAGRKLVEQDYSLDVVADRLLRMFRRLDQ